MIKNASYDGNLKLIETLLWENNAFFLLAFHLERLGFSAKHFSMNFDKEKILKALAEASLSFTPGLQYKVRLVMDRTNKTEVTSVPLDAPPDLPVKVALSEARTDRNDEFLYHKTTKRPLYDAATDEARKRDLFDLIFMNKEEEITEGAITNILVLKNKEYFTPPVYCGLLPGVYRKSLFESNNLPLTEKVLHKEDLLKADGLFVINSVRKLLPALLISRG
jgi:para-aminobenzoate synthetase / 4-amino-4-deoxychorismate lyase